MCRASAPVLKTSPHTAIESYVRPSVPSAQGIPQQIEYEDGVVP